MDFENENKIILRYRYVDYRVTIPRSPCVIDLTYGHPVFVDRN